MKKVVQNVIPVDTLSVNVDIIIIIIASLVLGFIKYGSLSKEYKSSSWQLKFIEIWNDSLNFFITGLIAYYFLLVRWPFLSKGMTLETTDFALFIIFILGLFGHLCVMSKNITDGIKVIMERFLK